MANPASPVMFMMLIFKLVRTLIEVLIYFLLLLALLLILGYFSQLGLLVLPSHDP